MTRADRWQVLRQRAENRSAPRKASGQRSARRLCCNRAAGGRVLSSGNLVESVVSGRRVLSSGEVISVCTGGFMQPTTPSKRPARRKIAIVFRMAESCFIGVLLCIGGGFILPLFGGSVNKCERKQSPCPSHTKAKLRRTSCNVRLFGLLH